MIDLTPGQLETVKRILAAHAPQAEVRAFGSRATRTAKNYSDLDLAIVGERKLTLGEMSRLREAFEESDLPFRVDVLDWHAISPEFRRVIEQGYEVIQNPPQDPKGLSESVRKPLSDVRNVE
jgi:predicted nucleotidyltransferase